ncbi:hypothetical protein [Azoarcus sp. L1K30]|nr:hypothetical protein [Azoarcus sp. L1K30]
MSTENRLPDGEPPHLVEFLALGVVVFGVPVAVGAALIYLLVGA